ncbi:MAG: H-X9-DG-CTERM domain-containing protein, partial [Nanoarchaeota archaeon]
TLLELLVVIGIIGLLAALLLPTLSKTKEKARQISCLSNLKQLQLGYYLYTNDNNDCLPENSWTYGESLSVKSTTNSWVIGNAKTGTDLSDIQDGSIFYYINNASVFHCPSDLSLIYQSNMTRLRSYSLESCLNGWTTTVKKYYLIKIPSQTFAFLDEDYNSIDDGVFLIAKNTSLWLNLASDRHSQGANISFLDGHSEKIRWRSPKIFIGYHQLAIDLDLEDLHKLQSYLPELF